MRSRELVILKDKIKRKYFLKTELKKIILKSIIQNFGANDIVRLSAFKKITSFKRKTYISRQNNVCLLTGRMGGVYKLYNLSRHSMKRMAKINMLQNTKIKSW
jgi:ribosomal protein S14